MDQIERFEIPTREALKELPRVTEDEIDQILAVFAHDDLSYEETLQRCDRILGTHGVVSLEIEDADRYTDEGIRYCPPFSYINMGDPYISTLARDHENSAWVVADWASMAEDYEREHKLGDFTEYAHKPTECRDCGGSDLTFESDGWVCDDCNTPHTAAPDRGRLEA